MQIGLKQNDIQLVVSEVHNNLNAFSRDMSFDYCYNYFKDKQYLQEHDMEKSCLALGFYLGNWGMFRKSFLQTVSLRHYENIINYISDAPLTSWNIDLDNYLDNIDALCEIYEQVKAAIKGNQPRNPSQTLVTKIMLGVFGCVPALDNNFVSGFNEIFKGNGGFRTDNFKYNIQQLNKFYSANKDDIDKLSSTSKTLDVYTGTLTPTNYPKSKIVDLYGYCKGEFYLNNQEL